MPSEQQVRDWIIECLRQHLHPDALRVEPHKERFFWVHTRKPGTKDQAGPSFFVGVSETEPGGDP